ncbi:MAG: cysteine--tRNA ligase [Candidatus Ranarchaeia archaeon]
MGFTIYNTLTKKKENFQPNDPKNVKMYVCGVTVYDESHIGHARTYVFFDVLRRYLESKNFIVTYVQNITDVDDKLIKKSKETGLTVKEIAEDNTRRMFKDMDKLWVRRATYYPKASENIDKMIDIIKKLVKEKKAYVVDGNVFFDVKKFEGYGKLSNQNLNKLKSGSRKAVEGGKRDPVDFGLWKANKGEGVKWKSPWGSGRPGWHIECSAMCYSLLGETIDIHGGGRDLIFPHHENEIAQSESYTNKQFSKYWIHTGFLTVDGVKMSKSLGNFTTINKYLEKNSPGAFRLMVALHHYRTPIDFTYEKIDEAEKVVNRFKITNERMLNIVKEEKGSKIEKTKQDKEFEENVKQAEKKFFKSLDDDFNTPLALTHLLDILGKIDIYIRDSKKVNLLSIKEALKFLERINEIFELIRDESEKMSQELDGEKLIQILIDIRQKARENKNWELSDYIRDKLKEMNIILQDFKEGTKWIIEK